MILKTIFWILFVILFYTYLGYALLLFILTLAKKLFFSGKKVKLNRNFEPEVCLFITAYNEKDYIAQKLENTFALNYPKEKIQYLWITDGSDDGTPELLKKYRNLEVHHQPERKGKMHAMNRGMKFVKAPIVIFSDTNTLIGKDSVKEIVTWFSDDKVGCVTGEKRIKQKKADTAAGAGEGFYWKFESWIKKMDAELNTAVGAVGELFAIRSDLFEEIKPDTILDDFMISLQIFRKGYRIAYAPNAYALEDASLNVKEELKRKVRIAAGGIQAIFRLVPLLNPFKYRILSWQYFSHKVLRWTLAPFALPAILVVNFFMVWNGGEWNLNGFYRFFFYFKSCSMFLR